MNVMPAYLKSAAMTAEWENQLLMMEKGQITDTQFMGEITSLESEKCTDNYVCKGRYPVQSTESAGEKSK